MEAQKCPQWKGVPYWEGDRNQKVYGSVIPKTRTRPFSYDMVESKTIGFLSADQRRDAWNIEHPICEIKCMETGCNGHFTKSNDGFKGHYKRNHKTLSSGVTSAAFKLCEEDSRKNSTNKN